MARIRIGTSGWSYEHWKGLFYPSGLPSNRRLPFYAESFPTVEINASFYRLPTRETFESWREATPPDFIFAVKASRYLTHMLRLKEAAGPLATLLERALGLEGKLGPILFQLPPQWSADTGRLASFLELLPPEHRYVFEFRHFSWFSAEVIELLRRRGVALCLTSSPSFPLVQEVTAPFVFIRMHGGTVLYGSRYSEDELSEWAAKIRRLWGQGVDCYVYFNNDAQAFAVENARELRGMLEPEAGA